MNDIETCIEDLQILYDESKEFPFSRKLAVDGEELNRIIIQLQGSIPEEIKRAKKIAEECDEYIEDAKRNAETIIRQAELQAEKLIDEHEIYMAAVEKSAELIKYGEDTGNTLIVDAIKFLDERIENAESNILNSCQLVNEEFDRIENTLVDTLKMLTETRKNLKEG